MAEDDTTSGAGKRPGLLGRLFGGSRAEGPAALAPVLEVEAAPAIPAPKPSWWQRLKGGLARSSSAITQGISDVFTKRKLDGAMLDELEDILIQADHGVATALRIREAVGKGRYDKQIEPDEVKAILASEVEKDPGFLARVAAGAGQEEWPQLAGHPAVLAAGPGEVVVPLALYVDGVPYTKADSFLAFWLYDLVTYKRHLVCVLRKSRICACGCKKWCSLWEIFRWLHWSFRALALGAHPAERHDGRPWELVDHLRASAAGTPLVRGALVLLKGDWAEYAHSLGMTTWSSSNDPCPLCVCRKGGGLHRLCAHVYVDTCVYIHMYLYR
jgi:hypothetical protein